MHQFIHQAVQFFFCFRRGEKEEDVVQVAFFRNDFIFPEEFGCQGSGDAEVLVVACFDINARGDEHEFHGVQEILVFTVAFESVPFGFGGEGPETAVGGYLGGVGTFPFPVSHGVRQEGAEVVAAADDFLSKFDAQDEGVFPEFLSSFTLVYPGVHVQGGEELVEGGGGGVHHVGVVHPFVGNVALLSPDVGVFFVYLGGHGETGLLFVHRLGDEDARVVGAQFQQQGRGVFHHGDELLVAHPGGVEENVVAEVSDAVDDLAGVVHAAVVGAEFNHRQTDGPLGPGLFRVFLSHQFPDVVFVEASFRYAADGAAGVAGGFHVHRNGAGKHQAQVDGFMVVPVVEDHVAGSQHGVHDDFIGRGCAVQDEIGFVRMKYGDADKKLDQLTEVSGGQFMYSHEERLKAVKLHVDSGMGLKGIMRTLGYPHDIKVLRQWCREFKFSREIHEVDGFDDGYSLKQKTLAVKYFVNCGDLRRTIREIGYPSSTQRLKIWVEKYNLNENDHWQADQNPVKWGQDRQTGSSPLIQENPFEEIEIASNAIYKDLGFLEELFQRRLATMSKKDSEVTIESLKEEMQVLLRNMENLRKENKALLKANQSLGEKTKSLDEKCQTLAKEYKELGEQTLIKRIEYEALEIAAETIKKEEGISLKTLTNREKAIVIDALLSRSKYPLKKLLTVLNMAKASYFYQKSAMKAGDKYAEIRETIKDKFKKNRSVYGYRRIWLALRKDGKILSEKLVRRFMKEDHLVPYRKKAKKYSSYKGEISPAPNLVNRNFHADELGKLLLTDITEFHISAGKVYLSAITDVFDGKIVAWTIGTSPNAKLVNTMLVKAREALGNDKHPIVHSDRGIHYQWPGWIALMKKFGWTRSMSKKGCSPDNAACEGVFGRVKNEMFYNRSWIGVSIKEFIAYLDDYLHWYNEDRIKITLGGMSPVEYRESLGIM